VIYVMVFAMLAVVVWPLHGGASRTGLLALIAMPLALLAALRGPDVARDFEAYEAWYAFRDLETGFVDRVGLFEAIYFALSDGFAAAGVPFRIFLFVLTCTAAAMKAGVILSFARTRAGACAGVLVYLGGFFLLHDFTQVRAGFAIALLFVAFAHLSEGRRGAFAVWVALACGFHTSSIVALALLLPRGASSSRWIDRTLVVTTVALFAFAASGGNPGTLIAQQLAVFDARVELYVVQSDLGPVQTDHLFSPSSTLLLIIALAALRRGRRSTAGSTDPREAAAIHLAARGLLVGLCFLAAFWSVQEISIRMLELTSAFLPILAAIAFSQPGRRRLKLAIGLWVAVKVYTSIFGEDPVVQPYAIFFG
jgi:hypothetical protein